jgi:hypothetical protein
MLKSSIVIADLISGFRMRGVFNTVFTCGEELT